MAFAALGRVCAKEIPQFLDSGVKRGAACLASGIGASMLMPQDLKDKASALYIETMRSMGVRSQNISDEKLEVTLRTNIRSLECNLGASPTYFIGYHLISSMSEVNFKGRAFNDFSASIIKSGCRGVAGTIAATPSLAALYTFSAFGLPWVQNWAMDYLNTERKEVALPLMQDLLVKVFGKDEKAAETFSQATLILGVGSLAEFNIEATGYQIKNSIPLSVVLAGTTAVAVRLASGVLLQYNSVAESQQGKRSENKYADLPLMIAGTSLSQHVINALMRSAAEGRGLKGAVLYIATGKADGSGKAIQAFGQFAGTVAQRAAFCTHWRYLTSKETTPPPKTAE